MDIIKRIFGNDGEQIGDTETVSTTMTEPSMERLAKLCLQSPGKIIQYHGSAFAFAVDRFGYNAAFRQYNENKGGVIVACGCYFDGSTSEPELVNTARDAGKRYYSAINRDNDRDTLGVEASFIAAIPEPSPGIRMTMLRAGYKMTFAMTSAFALALADLLMLRKIDKEGSC